jgi:predicted O-methyltransferase YrrM
MKILENGILALTMSSRIEGPLKLDKGLFNLFLSLPEDPLPEFQSALPWVRGRGRDHPRYGRWMHAFIKYYKPDFVVEVGTNAGGTAVGIARALSENGRGRLICIDSGEGVPRSFPDVARKNIIAAGLAEKKLELICENSRIALPRVAAQLKNKVEICLVDAAHTFDAALADINNGLPMMKSGGFVLVHDVDSRLDLADEASKEHPAPVLEAFRKVVSDNNFDWCILKFIRKHLGIIRINCPNQVKR